MSFRSKNSGRTILPFGLDYSDVLNNGHSTEKPQLILPIHGPLTQGEADASTQAISFCQLMADSGFYTGTINDALCDKKSLGNMSEDGIARYSDKYKKVKKIGRTIDQHPYQLELFPDELYSVMGITGKQKKKLLALSTYKSNGGLKQYNLASTLNEDDEANSIMEKLKNMAEELVENPEDGVDEQEDEDDMDDEFEEDDDDDYNAEKYFDDGDEDGGDEGGDEAAF